MKMNKTEIMTRASMWAIHTIQINHKYRQLLPLAMSKKNKTSDKAVGQLTRYMGWIKKNKKDDGVKGIIVAGRFDDKLDHARIMIPNCEVFLYDVIFKLSEYKK